MCGITGWINFKEDLLPYTTLLEKMTYRLIHRGPDSCGFWFSNSALIGHRRLIVVDPQGGQQPMIKEYKGSKYIITYNGELYNTDDLRNELLKAGHIINTTSDTEVLLLSYIEWGAKCLDYLNGIFSFAVWNDSNKSLFMARDRFGVKPLFYTHRNTSFLFASEIKALLENPLVKPEIDQEGISEIFALGPARTPGNGVFKGINELKPASFLILDSNGMNIRQYWSLESKPHTDSFATTVLTVRDILKDAIQRQLVSDVPVCTFLSGGLDSSIITAVASKHYKENLKPPLQSFSIDYVENEKHFTQNEFQPDSDSMWTKLVSKYYDTQHKTIFVDNLELVQALANSTFARDLPGMADIDSSLLIFCKQVKQEATVALSGECSDEIFGGYPWFYKSDLIAENTFPWARSGHQRNSLLSGELKNKININEYIQSKYKETIQQVPVLAGEDDYNAKMRKLTYLNIIWFMSTLLDRKDRMSMACGLEVRVPFCDHRLVQYVWNIPWEMKFHNGREKGLLREAVSDILPRNVLERKKSPFPKTHNPSYENAVEKILSNILKDKNSPLIPLIDMNLMWRLIEDKKFYRIPWFGQLMNRPQIIAYFIQINTWLKEYNISVCI